MERREDLARRGWRALEGGGDEAGRDSLGQVVDFEEELEERLSSEEDPVASMTSDAGNGGLAREEDGGAGSGASVSGSQRQRQRHSRGRLSSPGCVGRLQLE